ncbi:hypothetical protein JCM1841_000764 [Sporobolomyces salmonicolor]
MTLWSVATTLVAFAAAIRPATAQQLANGQYFQAGAISSIWMWQASGILSYGRCPFSVSISNCYISFVPRCFLPSLTVPRPRAEEVVCVRRTLNATGNLQSTTQASSTTAASNQRRAFTDQSFTLAAMSAPARKAVLDDDDLDAYFEAFPEQAPYRYPYGQRSHQIKRAVDGSSSSTTDVAPTTTSVRTTTAVPTTKTTTSAAPSATTTAATPRQRNEILSWPGALANTTWQYSWKSFQSRGTSTNRQFFHSWQILRRDANGGPVVTLDYVQGIVTIEDTVRGCLRCAQPLASGIAYWFGKTITHYLEITYGLNGSIAYEAYSETNLRRPLISYTATGDMGSSASLKFGNYRSYVAGQSSAIAYLGDFTQQRLA